MFFLHNTSKSLKNNMKKDLFSLGSNFEVLRAQDIRSWRPAMILRISCMRYILTLETHPAPSESSEP